MAEVSSGNDSKLWQDPEFRAMMAEVKMTPYQTKQYKRLGLGQQNRGHYHYTLTCGRCVATLATTSTQKAQQFIRDHGGHKNFILDTNVRPNSHVYARPKVLARLENLGLYVKAIHGEDDPILGEARITWKAIKAEADIEGSLERFSEILDGYNEYGFVKAWVRAIIKYQENVIQKIEMAAIHQMDGKDAG